LWTYFSFSRYSNSKLLSTIIFGPSSMEGENFIENEYSYWWGLVGYQEKFLRNKNSFSA
jgi:hypothetical protein